MAFREYSRRLIDTKVEVKALLRNSGGDLPRKVEKEIETIFDFYQTGGEVWNWKIQHASEKTQLSGYDPVSLRLAKGCAESVRRWPSTLIKGKWYPDVAIRCYWAKARTAIDGLEGRLRLP